MTGPAVVDCENAGTASAANAAKLYFMVDALDASSWDSGNVAGVKRKFRCLYKTKS